MAALAALALTLEALAARWINRHPVEDRRILRGLQLAKRPGQVATLGGGLYLVRSSKGDAWYQVSRGSCECADHCYRAEQGVRCAHRWALSLLATVDALPDAARFTREAKPTVRLLADPRLVAAAEQVLGPEPVTVAPQPRPSDTPTLEIRQIEIDEEEVGARWAEWEEAVADL